tara:strand:+ start:872 stop:1135 length:264 start_codon:yes stop_codon:yes gene_type:complete
MMMNSDSMKRLEEMVTQFLDTHPEANDRLPEIQIELGNVIKQLQVELNAIVSNEAKSGIDKLTAMLRHPAAEENHTVFGDEDNDGEE